MGIKIETYNLQKIKNRNNYNRIINEIKKIPGIKEVHINKGIDLLSIETDQEIKNEQLLKAIHKFEKNAFIQKTENKEILRKVLYLKGLDCGNCALKIENLAKRVMDHEQIIVDFATTRFIIETKDRELIDNIFEEVEAVAHKVDPKIIVMEASSSKKNREEEDYKPWDITLTLVAIGIGIFILGFIIAHTLANINGIIGNIFNIISLILYLGSYILVGNKVLRMFLNNISHGRLLDENFLMTIASIGAIFTGHYEEAVMVMFLYQIGERLQDYAVHKSRKSISDLLSLEAEVAHLKITNEITDVDVETILPGDIIVVQVGEMIPLDGIIMSGNTTLNTKSITGEAAPVLKKKGEAVLSGSINIGTTIEIKVTHPYGDSMVTKILDLVENASAKKAKAENFITKFARFYTPIIVILALIISIIVPLIDYKTGISNLTLLKTYQKYIYTAMSFLVISCPCAIVISVPLAFFAGIGLSSKRGILIKGSNYLEALTNVENMVFDKTGTLTKGEFAVREIVPTDDTISKEEVLKTLAYAEFYSTHPIGLSILDAYGIDKIFPEIIADYTTMYGKGIKATINGTVVYAGNDRMIAEMFPNIKIEQKNGVVLYVIKGKKYIGHVVVGDILREEASNTIYNLKANNIKVTMLTGDSKVAGDYTANLLQIDNVYSELLPDNKVQIVEEIKEKSSKGKTVYVGDGINDAPVIAVSDVGIAMGGTGSDATIKIADVVIMSDNLDKLGESIKIAKYTRKIVTENIVFSLIVKLIVLILSLCIQIPLWLAIFSDVGISLLAIINSMRITRLFKKSDEIVKEKN